MCATEVPYLFSLLLFMRGTIIFLMSLTERVRRGEMDGMMAKALLSLLLFDLSLDGSGGGEENDFLETMLVALSLHVDVGRALRNDFLGEDENPEIFVDMCNFCLLYLQPGRWCACRKNKSRRS